MDPEKKLEFVLSTIGPMARHTIPYLAPILGGTTPDRGELLGSGVYCQLDGHRTIVTASHVLRDGLTRFEYLAASIRAEDQRPVMIHGWSRYDHATDLAILDLPDDFPGSDEPLFWPEERIDSDGGQLSTDFLFLHGFPGLRSQLIPLPIEPRVVSRSLPYGVMQRLDNLPESLEPYQFAMDFDITPSQSERGSPEEDLFDEHRGPRGLSGSPVWRIGASGRKRGEWSPDLAQLVGIVTHWDQGAKLLIATKASKILELATIEAVATTKG
jgi:hypothetical protein